ncbi:MAG: efflux RND transporter periplasmic adaptor subunit [Planctomycetes bacterium]|nr:efflux RND transporter periplasmic adaptor subunit [Planctomycetota bacterium]
MTDRNAPPPVPVGDGLDRLRIDRTPPTPGSRRRSKAPWIWVGVLLLVIGGVAYSKRESLSAPEVRTAKVRRITATEGAVRTSASGYVVARTRAAISSKMSGRLEKIQVDVGDRVVAGQMLGELGHADLDASVAQAEADIEVRRRNIATAEAQHAAADATVRSQTTRVAEMDARLVDAERTVALQEKLVAGGAGIRDTLDSAKMQRSVMAEQVSRGRAGVESSKADVARAEADLASAAAGIMAAKAGLAASEAAVAYARAVRADAFIVAPFAGVVVRKEAEVGEMVSPVNGSGSTTRGAIVTLVDFASLEMEVDVIERDISKVVDGAPCRIVLDARRDHPYAGVVRQKVPTADRATSTVQVKVAFKDVDAFVLPEMGGRVEFLDPARADSALGKDRVIAPAAAFVERDGKPGVWILRDGRAEWLAARKADGAASAPGEADVAEGLAGGEEVIVSPPANLNPGKLVRVVQ